MSGKVGSQFTNSGVIGKPVLGTPESGDLSDADLTFPTGHLIKYGKEYLGSSTSAIATTTHTYTVIGDDITNLAAYTPESGFSFASFDSSSAHTQNYINTISLDPVTLDGTGHATITYNFLMQNENANAGTTWLVKGTSGRETNITFMEIQA